MDNNNFFSIDRLVEFGVSIAIANQMAQAMNQYMQTMHVPGSSKNISQPLQQIFYVVINSTPVGPLDSCALSQLIFQKKITKDSLAWMPGMLGWQPIEKVPSILKLVALTPPPIPSNY